MRDLVTVDTKNIRARAALGAGLIFALLLGWFGIRWQLGSMLAALTPPNSADAPSIADVAVDLAPSDALASWLYSTAGHATPDVGLLENSVRLSPFDYRWRIELARAYDQTDRPDEAEREFKKAVDLAPTYAYPRWQIGNFYLRNGRTDEAFAELKKAAANNHTYREQVFSLAWDYFDKDAAKVEQLAPETSDARAALALFFAARGRAAESLKVWNTLSADEKAAHPQFAKLMAQGLYAQRRFPQALEFFRQLGVGPDAQAGTVTNPGFERTILPVEDSPFGWQIIRNDSKVDITADNATKHSGARSLRLAFRNYAKPVFTNIFQVIAVDPATRYRLTFWVLTENLKTGGPPLLQAVNANDDKLLGASKPFATGSTEWQQYTIDIATPENCVGIRLQTSRVPCGEQCPIVGTLWYDDFELTADSQ
jgi:hypothetical protein